MKLADFSGKKVSQLLVVIFKDGLNSDQWKNVFKETDELTQLRNQIARLNKKLNATGERSADEQEKFLHALTRSAEILIQFYQESAAYLLSWADNDQCEFSTAVSPELKCVLDESNTLNGGMPHALSALALKKMGKDYLPSLVFSLGLNKPGTGNFEMALKLKPETNEGEKYFAGEVEVAPNAHFLKDGKAVPHFPFGYVELRF